MVRLEPARVADLVLETLAGLAAVRLGDGDLLAHALNAGAAAMADNAPPALIAATLLHDVGHGLEPEDDIDAEHADLGADWLGGMFGPAVTEPVRLHVAAKRYLAQGGLVAFDGPSGRSLASQGGAMSPHEAQAFARSGYAIDALRVRSYDSAPFVTHGRKLTDFRTVIEAAAAETRPRAGECDRPIVYVGMCADVLHRGHLNILDRAAALGRVVVGILTDRAVASYKRVPLLDFAHRCELVGALRQVEAVVAQDSLDYRPNLLRFLPAYVVHGDDWRQGPQAGTRTSVLQTLARWDGKLVEPAYTADVSSSAIQARLAAGPRAPDDRCAELARAMRVKPLVRIIEAHSGLSAMIGDRARLERDGRVLEFDGLWSGSLTTAAVKARADTGVVDFSTRMAVLADILHASRKPILFDAEEGGEDDELIAMQAALQARGVSGIVLEDKTGPKRNSFSAAADTRLADTDLAAHRLRLLVSVRHDDHQLIVARLEGMVLGLSVDETVARALAYERAGADLILPHSKHSDAGQILAFAERYRTAGGTLPLVAIPTTYATVTEAELIEAGFSIVIYANQLLRAATEPMAECALDILEHGSAGTVSARVAPVKRLVEVEHLSVTRKFGEARSN